MTDQHKKNIAASKIGALNPMWKGDDVGYYTLHAWLTEHFGSPAKCEKCGKIGEKVNGRWNIEWASKDNKTYSRKRKDYLGMCRSCHLKHDYKLGAREGVKDAHLKRHRGEGGKFL